MDKAPQRHKAGWQAEQQSATSKVPGTVCAKEILARSKRPPSGLGLESERVKRKEKGVSVTRVVSSAVRFQSVVVPCIARAVMS